MTLYPVPVCGKLRLLPCGAIRLRARAIGCANTRGQSSFVSALYTGYATPFPRAVYLRTIRL